MNPQAFNRYSYVKNRPINFNDPTGHCDETDASCRNRLASTLPKVKGSIPKPERLDEGGEAAWKNLEKLGLLGNDQAAMGYLVSMEFNDGTLNSNATWAVGTQGYDILQGMRNRYVEYCDNGAWSAECLTKFWAYHEPVLKGSPPHGNSYYDSMAAALIPEFASAVLSAPQDPTAGCASGSSNMCHYALAKQELLDWAGDRNLDLKAPSSVWHMGYAPNEILHLYNNTDSYFDSMSQGFYESLFNPNSPNYCPLCVY